MKRWQQIEALFQEAVARRPAEREAWLRQACADDSALLRELRDLLANYSDGTDSKAWIANAAVQLAAEQHKELAPQTRVGPYEIITVIGAGGMGTVYRALDTRLGREVAIKFSSDRFTERFEREARAVAALNHPNICTLHDVGSNYLVMEYVEGDTPKGPLPLDEVLRIARQIADALDAAHDKGIVHRDLKPRNIKVKPDGTVKVLDFGLAKMGGTPVASPDNSPTLSIAATQAGVILGTAAYMAPEQARGKTVDKRADIWAFGVLLYELITGRQLFQGEDISETMAAVIKQDPQWDDVPRRVRRLLQSCLEKDPKNRLRDVGDAWRLLEDASVSRAEPVQRRSWVILASSIAVLGIASIALFLGPWRPSKDAALVRLDVDLGANVALNPIPTGDDVIVSPDGARLLYSSGFTAPVRAGRGAGNRRGSLLIRRLDEPNAVELSGTAGSTAAFFSPDSRWIGFIAALKLNKISVDGGAVIPIADVPGGSSATWSEDGSIILGSNTGLWRIHPSEGKLVKVAEPDEAYLRVYQVLPGNRTALAVSYGGTTGQFASIETATIQAISLADGSRKVIAHGAVSPRYLPSGHLVYVSKGTLFAVPFNPNRLEMNGDAVPILDDVEFNAQTGVADISFSDNGTIVYRKGSGVSIAGSPAVLDWIDAGGKRSALISTLGPYSRPRISPDGTQLAVLITAPNSRDEWVYDLRREAAIKITFGGLSITTPAWTPDSRRLVFGNGGSGIYWTRADGSGQPQLLLEGALAFVTSYSERVKRLAYFGGGTQRIQIFTVPLFEENGQFKAGKPEPFFQSSFSNQEPEFSPDGKWVAYTTNETGRNEINVRPFPSSGQTSKVQISTAGGLNPHWSKTANELLYRSDDQIMAVSYTVNDGALIPEKPRIRVDKLGGTEWDLAPDGRIAVVREVETPQPASPDHMVVYIQNFFDELRRRVPVK